MRRARTWLAGTAVAVVGVLALGAVPPATADRADPVPQPPSQAAVDAAKADAAQKAAAVSTIKTRLLLANRRLEQSAVRAEQASEAYNGARWELDRATEALRAARREAARARATVAEQRDAIGALVAASYQQASDLTGLHALMDADGPEGVLDQYVAYQGATTSLQADYERFAAADSLARVFAQDAADAAQEQARVARRAEAARATAQAAADAAQASAARIAEEKDTLIRQLAQAQDISVSLARKRQAALEEIARLRAEERAHQQALAAARAAQKAQQAAQERAEEKAQRQARREQANEAARAAAAAARDRGRRDQPQPDPQPAPQPAQPQPAPEPQPQPQVSAPAPSGGVDQVLAFARSQVGEPYQWAAAGPSAWDCSGLTMRAWEQAGVSLPHYTVAQYEAGTPISASQLRPGDLVFWSTSSSPAGIHHVALYLGDGMIVHAPRTGRDVTVESMYYWTPPTHFSRV